jgi:ketosteroid isomerase-like protein
MRRLALATLISLAFLACTQAVDQRAATTGPDVEAVRAWFEQYNAAVNAGVSLVADDAVVMPPDELPIAGIEEIRPRYEAVFETYAFQFTARVDEIVVAGDLAVLRAFFEETLTLKAGGEPTELSGSWLIVLKKQSDGSWKLWRNMWGVIPAPPQQTM